MQIDGNNLYNEVLRVAKIDAFEADFGYKVYKQAKCFGISVKSAIRKGCEAKRIAQRLEGQKITIVVDKNNNNVVVREKKGLRILGDIIVNGVDYGRVLKDKNVAYDYLGKDLYEKPESSYHRTKAHYGETKHYRDLLPNPRTATSSISKRIKAFCFWVVIFVILVTIFGNSK